MREGVEPCKVVPGSRCQSKLWGTGRKRLGGKWRPPRWNFPHRCEVGASNHHPIRTFMAGCTGAIIKPKVLWKWQLEIWKKGFNETEERGYREQCSLYSWSTRQELAQPTLPFCRAEGQTSGEVQTSLRTQLLAEMLLEQCSLKVDSGFLASAKPGNQMKIPFPIYFPPPSPFLPKQ